MAVDALLVRSRVPLGFAAAIAYLWLAQPTVGSVLVGLPLVVAGEAIRVMASGRIEKNRRLATSGPYAHVRHPLYVGSALIVTGFAVAGARLALVIGLPVAFLLLYTPVARREERALAEQFGEAYDEWSRAVPAFLPRLRPWRGPGSDASFSLEHLKRHREYRAILGVLGVLGFLLYRAL